MATIESALEQLKQQRDKLDKAITALEELGEKKARRSPGRRGKLSAAGMARIRAAQKARWAKFREARKK